MAYSKLPRIRVHLFGYIFSPDWIPTVATFLLLALLIHLGMWQLHRAQEKKQLEKDFSTATMPIKINTLKQTDDKNLRYRCVKAMGTFDNHHVILLDNKTYHQRTGYHVFTPFILENEKRMLLVNRGFIAVENRSQLPSIPLIEGRRMITGLLYFPSQSFVLKKEDPPVQWPLRLQTIDLKQLRQIFHQPSYPFYLLLQKGEDSNLVRDWHPINFPASRHMGYAIQWFSLALTLLIIYLSLNISRAD